MKVDTHLFAGLFLGLFVGVNYHAGLAVYVPVIAIITLVLMLKTIHR